MKLLGYILLGLLLGTALGFLLPIALFGLTFLMDPQGMRQGGATPFAIFLILTVPAGAVIGAIAGIVRATTSRRASPGKVHSSAGPDSPSGRERPSTEAGPT